MIPLKQAIAWWCFVPDALTPEQCIQAAVRLGYAGIELVGQQYWQQIQDAGLKIVSLGGHQSIVDGLNRRENAARITDEIGANLELAAQWGIPNVICFSGSRNGISDAEGLEITIENLRLPAQMAEQAGVTLVLELLNSKVDHPDYQCDHTAWGVEVCKQVGSPNLKLLYDIYHMQIMEGDIIRTIRDYHAYIGHYHTAGVPGRHELDDRQELNYPAIMRAIQQTGYTGYIGQEFIPTGDAEAGLKAAFDLCQGV
ncbi:MAG: hydroxypyruvate isomerase family protein [Phototrophicaceae bacterium]|jgi:hydroxypyruvate isomerase